MKYLIFANIARDVSALQATIIMSVINFVYLCYINNDAVEVKVDTRNWVTWFVQFFTSIEVDDCFSYSKGKNFCS